MEHGTAIRYQSFGGLAVVLIGSYLFHPEGGLLSWLPLPDWVGYAPVVLIAVSYSLLVTLPIYFYFRTIAGARMNLFPLALSHSHASSKTVAAGCQIFVARMD